MYWKTSILLVTALNLAGFSYLATAGEGKDGAVKKDRMALQGTWKTSEENNAGIQSIRFDGDKVVVTFKGDETATGIATIDPTKKPKTIDIKVTGGTSKQAENDKGKISLGIYDVDDGKLRWHANRPGADERPKDFENATHALMVFEREKKK
jgi:uncharacterized protein (TIGR03067 family)